MGLTTLAPMKKIEAGDWFLIATSALQLCAAMSYGWKRKWLEGMLCLIYAVAYVILLLLSLRSR